jgi:hypothetical protein
VLLNQNKMKTQNHVKEWGLRSVSYWVTLFLALGIIFVGVRFIVAPSAGAEGFGIPLADAHDLAYGRIKGIRDVFSGVVLLPLLWMRMRSAAAWVFTTAIIVPVTDGFIVLVNNGAGDVPHLLIHSGTALVMMVTSVLLFRGSRQ